MKVFFHNADLDGHCSGAIVKKKYPECETIGVNYGDQLDKESIKRGEEVFVVDFCFPWDDMIWLNKHARLTWCDHHKTALKDYAITINGSKAAGEDFLIAGRQEIDMAGCELTWLHLFGEPIPRAVYLLGRYDVWIHDDPDVLPFQYGMRSADNTWPGSTIWESLLITKIHFSHEQVMKRFIDAGRDIMRYEEKQNLISAKSMAFECEFQGLKALAINKFGNSKILEPVYDPERHDIMITFNMSPKGFWKMSLYSSKNHIDCGELARKYNGGGHKGAAGFQIYMDSLEGILPLKGINRLPKKEG